MQSRIVPEAFGRWYESAPTLKRSWLTTADVARRLGVTTRWVRSLARHGKLRGEVTESGQRVFQRGDVQRYLLQRNDERARRRSETLAIVRVRMLKATFEPRQVTLPLFGRPKVKLVRSTWSERPDPHAEVKASRSFGQSSASEKPHYVNRRAHGR